MIDLATDRRRQNTGRSFRTAGVDASAGPGHRADLHPLPGVIARVGRDHPRRSARCIG